MNKKMMKRLLSMLMVLTMVLSMVPVHAFAAVGDGTAAKPWQVNDEVTVNGSGEPVGSTAENTKWQLVSKTEGDCTVEVHAHGETCEKVYDHAAHSHTFDAACTLVCSGIHVCTEECAEDCALQHEAHVAACCSKTEHAHVEGECVKACPKTVHSHDDGNCQKPVLTTTWKLIEKPAVCDVTGCTKGKDHEGKHDVCTKGEDCKDGVHVEGCDLYVTPNCTACGLAAHEGDCACTGEANCPAQETHNDGCIKGQTQSNPCEEGTCDHVAVVGEDHFETFAAALDAENAVEGQLAIRLLKSVNVEDPIAVAAGLTVTITYEEHIALTGTQLFTLGEGTTVTINDTVYDSAPDAVTIPEELCSACYRNNKCTAESVNQSCDVCKAASADNLKSVCNGLPTAIVTNTGAKTVKAVDFGERDENGARNIPLTLSMNFEIDEAEDEVRDSLYKDWYTDYILTLNIPGRTDPITLESDSDCYLAGQYDMYNDTCWIQLPLPAGFEIPVNTAIPIMEAAFGARPSYYDIGYYIKDFDCGLYFSNSLLQKYPDIRVTLELRMYDPDPEDGSSESYRIGNTYYYEPGVVARVTNGENSKGYPSLEDAVEEAQKNDTIILLDDVTIANGKDITIPDGVTLDGNGYSINAYNSTDDYGYIIAGGELTITGETKIEKFSASYYNHVINIGAGASLNVFGSKRVTLGHGSTFNITGSVANAKTADKAAAQPSLIVPAGISITDSSNAAMNVTNAYIKLGLSTGSKSASGTFDINFTNSIVDISNNFGFHPNASGTFDLDVKNSVLNLDKNFDLTTAKCDVLVDNSVVTVGSSLRNDGRLKLTNGSSMAVNTQADSVEHGGYVGTTTVDNSKLTINCSNTQSAVNGKGTGKLNIVNGGEAEVEYIKNSEISIDKNSKLTVNKIIGNGSTVTVDATGFIGEPKLIIVGNITEDSFEGTIEVTGAAYTVDAKGLTITHQHIWDETEWDNDANANKHYHGCTVTGCTGRKDEAEHSGGTATCTKGKECTVCGQEYGDFAAHTIAKQDAVEPGLITDGWIEHYKCSVSVCQKRFSDAAGEQELTDAAVIIPRLVTISGNAAELSEEAVEELSAAGKLKVNLQDKEDFPDDDYQKLTAVKIPTLSLDDLEEITVVTAGGEVKLNEGAVSAIKAQANCSEITVSLQRFLKENKDDYLSEKQNKLVKAKKLEDQVFFRVRILDCDGEELLTKEADDAIITIKVKNGLKAGIASSRYKVYWITDDKMTELSKDNRTYSKSTENWTITLDHLSDYVIGYIPKSASSAATGDDSNVFIWAGVGLAALVVLGGVLIIGRKKKR